MKNNTSYSGIDTTCSSPNDCYDALIKKCVSCSKLNRNQEETTAILRVISTTAQEMTPPTTAQKCPALISGICACAGLVLAMAAVLWFVIQKQKRRTRKSKADEEDPKKIEIENHYENHVHKGPDLPGEDNLALLRCPPSNDTSHGTILKDDISKMAVSDVTVASSLSSCEEKGNHTFPLPATELGATELVTTKTIQENFIKEELL
uniref:tumor necrosis factor receptor superfamily member 13C-like n=1 Tax=Euleptes europaea TaxID=460621 RepID=UPI002540EB93|nr:tumor necrosis factor receptor superfamily member 13C-like [Euleptes europaea]